LLEQATGSRVVPEATFADVASLAGLGLTVVYLAATPVGGIALTIQGDGRATARRLELLTSDQATAWIQQVEESVDQSPTSEPVEGGAARSTRSGGEPDAGVVERVVEEIAQSVIDAISDLPSTGIRLVPVGLLAGLPLAAAISQAARAPLPVCIAGSARLHAVAERHVWPVAPRFLAVTNPAPVTLPDGYTPPALTGASREGEWLERNFDHVEHMSLHDATKGAVIEALRDADIIHLGAHGEVDLDHPHRSCAYLCDGEDGAAEALYASDLQGLSAVILACCTLGKSGRVLPDEAQGLPTALLSQGVGLVVAPLWAVGDAATYGFVVDFYTQWIKRASSPLEAFRFAQHRARRRYANSATWAAFFLAGS
jgi:CHAT domain-containing protein